MTRNHNKTGRKKVMAAKVVPSSI